MAEIQVDVTLPSATSVDVTSPTQALAANVIIPGPQGPRGLPLSLNNITSDYITITGQDGNYVYTGLNTIYISGNSGYFQSAINTLTTNLNLTGANLNTSINNLSGLFTGYTGSLDATYATDSQLQQTGSSLVNSINSLSGTLTSTYATITNLALTGSTLQTQINNLDNTYATDIALASTGNTLQTQINNLGTTYATVTNLALTGSTLENKIGSLSGTLTSDYATIINLASTGTTLQNYINSLSGSSVLLYGNQTIDGTKTFRDKVYIHDLYVTGTEFIANVQNNFIESPYILLNLTGGATDGGIFFVTGSGLTGINDLGPIIGFDHTDKFKFGISSRGSDLSTLNDIAAFQDITAYSGFVNNKYATIINLASTGSTLQNQIDNLGNTYATVTNLASTGSTLESKIASLSGSAVLLYGDQTISGDKTFTQNINISGTGTFNAVDLNNIDQLSLSGIDISVTSSTVNVYGNILISGNPVLTGIPDANWASQAEINSLSGQVVFTTGDQTINGLKTFTSGIDIYSGTNPQSIRVFNQTGTNTGEFGLFGWQNNQLVIGSQATNSGILRNITITGSNINITTTGEVYIGDGALRVGKNTAGGTNIIAAGTNVLSLQGNATNGGYGNVAIGPNGAAQFFVPLYGYPQVRSDGYYAWSNNIGNAASTPDLYLYRDSAGILAQRNGTSAQQFRVYNSTGTNSGEFGLIGWITGSGFSPSFIIGAQATNSGILRSLIITGDSISYSGKRLTIAHANAGLFFDATGPTIRGNHWGAGDAGFVTYRNGLDMGRGGAKFLRVDAGSPTVIVGNGATSSLAGIGFDGTNSNLDLPDAFIIRDASGVLSLRNPRTNLGNSPQQFRIYNTTGTNSGEFGLIGWQNNQLFIGAQKQISGILRDIVVSGANINLYAMGDGTVQGGQLQIPYNTDYNSLTFRNIQSNVNYLQLKRYLGSTSGPLFTTIGFASSISTNSASTADLLVERDAAGILAQRNGTSAQQFRIYNITGTNTGEFGLVGWINSGLVIGPQQTNSGILRNLTLTGSNINLSATGNILIDRNSQIIFPSRFGGISTNPNRLYTDSPTDTNNNYYFYGGNGGGNFVFNNSDGNWNLVLATAGAIGFTQSSTAQKGSFSPDVLLYRDAANTLALRNGTTSQQFRAYNTTGTNSGEFGLFGWQNNNLIIGAQQSQSGTLRDVFLTGRNVNINASGVFNIFGNTNILGNLNVTGNIFLSGNPVLTGSNHTHLWSQLTYDSQIGSANAGFAGRTAGGNLTLYAGTQSTAVPSFYGWDGFSNTSFTAATARTNLGLTSTATAVENTFVRTTGDQTIGGNKTFTGITTFSGQEINLVDTALNLSGVGDMTFSGTNINFINSPVFISGTNLRVSGDVSAYNVYTTGKIGVGTSSPTEKLEVAGNIKFGDVANGYSAKFMMWDPANAVYNTGDWYDSQLTLTDSANNKSIALNFYGDTNSLISNGSILRLPSGKDDFIAMDSEVVHKTGNETISGIKTFIGNHIISGNTTVSGSINISGNYDIYSQIENVKKLAIAYAIAL
jgi:hypothetical protein